jgi:Peptidase family M48
MTKGVLWTFGILRLISRGLSLVSAQGFQPRRREQLSSFEEIRAGMPCSSYSGSLWVSPTRQSRGPGKPAWQKIGDKVAQNAQRKLPHKFHLDPHPGFRSAAGYSQIVVASGILALMSHEEELAVVLGHEIAHRSEPVRPTFARRNEEKTYPSGSVRPAFHRQSLGQGRRTRRRPGRHETGGRSRILSSCCRRAARDPKPGPPPKDSPSLGRTHPAAKDEIKNHTWEQSSPEKSLDATVDFILHRHPSFLHLSI